MNTQGSEQALQEILTLETKTDTAHITPLGANLRAWKVAGHDLIDGYRSPQEAQEHCGLRSGIMAPWSNRLRARSYTWQGKTYTFTTQEQPQDLAMHGLVENEQWEITHADKQNLTLTHELKPIKNYPFSIHFECSYHLAGPGELEFNLKAKNTSNHPAPVGLGWHPYFILGDLSQVIVNIPAKTQILVDDELIPLSQDKAMLKRKPEPLTIGKQVIDTAFTQLQDAPLTASGPAGELTITANLPTDKQGIGIWHLFTGDTLTERPRHSIAIEPCLLQTDAFNREELARATALEPGTQRELTVKLKFKNARTQSNNSDGQALNTLK